MFQRVNSSTIKNIDKYKLIRVLFSLIILGFGLFFLLKQAHRLPINDFIEYWSTSRILMNGGNPYSTNDLLIVQQEGGLEIDRPTIMYNPPWLLPIILPFGYFSRPSGQLIWLFFQTAVLIYCSNHLWNLYLGKINHRWIGWIATFSFGAVFATIFLQGQISPLLLLGLVGFLISIEKTDKEWLAGLFAVFITIKPQVTYIFFIALLFWVVSYKKWSVVISFVSGLTILSAIAFLFDHQIFYQYIQCILNNAPAGWATPTIGTYLRLLFNPTEFLLSFVTLVVGIIWLISYWIRKRNSWEWKNEIPLIVFISVITSSYIWTYDMVVLLIPIILALIWQLYENPKWISISLCIIYVTINIVYLRLHLVMEDSKFIWFAPALFAWYLIAHTFHVRQRLHPSGEVV